MRTGTLTSAEALAIGHIKHSGGKLYGLRLAAADALLFPLLLLGGTIVVLVSFVFAAIAPQRTFATVTSAVVLGTLLALVVCFFFGRAVWRAVVGT